MNQEDLKIDLVVDKPKSGMWHNGPNNSWLTITHLPTMQSVTVYGRSQHKLRARALDLLDLMIHDCRYEKCQFPENMKEL